MTRTAFGLRKDAMFMGRPPFLSVVPPGCDP